MNEKRTHFRNLKADEVEIRVKTVGKGYALFLLYKTARTDTIILNETFGIGNWYNDFGYIGNNFVSYVYIRHNNEWVKYTDTGIESNQDATKGLFSDSFKRACSKMGIGIELYSAPNILIKLNNNEYTETKNGNNIKYNLNKAFKLHITQFEVKDNIITNLEIRDGNNNIRFTYNKGKTGIEKKENDSNYDASTDRYEHPIDFSIIPAGDNKGKKWIDIELKDLEKYLQYAKQKGQKEYIIEIEKAIKDKEQPEVKVNGEDDDPYGTITEEDVPF